MKNQKITIGVVGGSDADEATCAAAYETGKLIANRNAVLVCGGLGGVMEAAARGAYECKGIVCGVLPGDNKSEANQWVTIALPTGMGYGRNLFVVRFSDAIIAFPGSYGTLSEISLALNLQKTVVAMPGVWDLKKIGRIDANLFKEAFDPGQAVGLALSAGITS